MTLVAKGLSNQSALDKLMSQIIRSYTH